jgi:hypothetical protein
MNFKKAILVTAIMAAPVLAFAADNMGAAMHESATDVKAVSDKPVNPDCPMMGRGYRYGMMGRGMGMQGDDGMMDMMDRQQRMEHRMDMMEMMMDRQMGMQGGRGGPMMGAPRGSMMPGMMGQGMGMQGGPMMNNRMHDMRGMNMEQQQQMMQQRMDMMQQRIDTIQKQRDMMQQRMDMMSKQNQ